MIERKDKLKNKAKEENIEEKKLTEKEKLFCRFYTSVWKETFMNWTQSYLKVYPKSQNNTANVEASKFLSKPKISNYMQKLYDNAGLNENTIKRELMSVITQKEQLWPKVSALKLWADMLAMLEKAKQKALDDWSISQNVLWYMSTEELLLKKQELEQWINK